MHVVDAARETNTTAPFNASPGMVLTVHLDQCGDALLLVAAHAGGVSFWRIEDEAAKTLPPPTAHRLEDAEFARGICTSGDRICVGSSKGEVLVFAASPEIELVRTSHGHASALTALAAAPGVVVTADDKGEIRRWDMPHLAAGPSHALDLGRSDEPCTCISAPEADICVAGFATGHLRVYVATLEGAGLLVELQAHSRPITSLDARGKFVCTVAEDTYLHVWKVQGSAADAKDDLPDISRVFSHQLDNASLTGVRFASPIPRADIVLAAYDVDHFFTFDRVVH